LYCHGFNHSSVADFSLVKIRGISITGGSSGIAGKSAFAFSSGTGGGAGTFAAFALLFRDLLAGFRRVDIAFHIYHDTPMQLHAPEVQVVPIDQLKPWSKNPRKGHAVKAIARFIESFGYLSPIIVQKGTMRVLAGHGRLAALRKSNVTNVPVLVADLDDEKAAAFTIADNKLHDTSKFDLGDLGSLMGNMSAELALLTGFNDDELSKLAALQDELADVGNVAINARKGTLYAGDDNSGLKAAMNDRTLVSFSGGKDSLAVLLLTIEFCRPLGLKVHAGFIDEEFVPTSTLNFVKWVFYESEFSEHIVPHWFCWQMDSEIYCAGESRSVVQWGADRPEWLREPPEGALMDRRNVYDIFSPDAPLAELFAGKSVVSLLGTRAAESLARLSAVRYSAASDKHPCFLRAGQTNGVFRAVPLYDWVMNDVLKFLGERNCINPIYYEMLCAGKTLRTDTPLHGRRCNLAAFKKIDPVFFDKLCALFPEVHAAALYNLETKPTAELVDLMASKYGRSWKGLLEYIRAEIKGDSQIERAETCLKEAAKKHQRLLRRGLSGVPLLRIWKLVVGRDFDHSVGIDHWSKSDYEWEGKAPPSENAGDGATERQDEAEVAPR